MAVVAVRDVRCKSTNSGVSRYIDRIPWVHERYSQFCQLLTPSQQSQPCFNRSRRHCNLQRAILGHASKNICKIQETPLSKPIWTIGISVGYLNPPERP